MNKDQIKQIEKATGFYYDEDTWSFESNNPDYPSSTFTLEDTIWNWNGPWSFIYWETDAFGTLEDNEVPFPEELKEKIIKILGGM